MKKLFLLQVLIILCAGLATGFAFTLNSKVQLRLPPNLNQGLGKSGESGNSGVTGSTGNSGTTGNSGVSGNSGTTGTTGGTGVKGPTGATGPTEASSELFISLAVAKKLFDSKNAIFIDARPKDEYFKSHILGAMQLEKGDLDGPPPAKVSNYLPGMEVVVYCHGELCTDSENVVKRLLALNKGIGPYHIIKAGFPGWEAAKYPVDAGREVGFE